MQTHLTLRPLKGRQKPDRDVQALFSVQPDRRAVLFIHGYKGDAITTWSDFQELLPACSRCKSRDIIFYGYDGLRAEMNASASIFRGFLGRLLDSTQQFLRENLPSSIDRGKDFGYDELTIVAHSLGAVIARRALLDATRARAAWASKTKLVLFAPAHKGAKVVDLALEVSSPFSFTRLFAFAARFESPLIDQLKHNSEPLQKLLQDTDAATKDGSNVHLLAKKVIIAEYERIVENETFSSDPPPETIPDTTHTSVCKPRSDFLEPLSLLEVCL